MTTFKCIESLEENPAEVFLQVTSILIKLVDNVLLYPSNPKYRKLRLENKLVSSVIMPSIGAMECLFEIGFQEDDDALLLPPESTSIEKLTQFRTEISNRRNKYLKDNGNASKDKPSQTHEGSVERQSTPQPEAASLTSPPRQITNSSISKNSFLAKLHTMSTLVLQYEQENTKRKALTVVPMEKISQRVQTCMRQHQQQAVKDKQPVDEASLQETIFFLELMYWFKNDFFEWVNSPKCPKCHCDTQFVEMSSDQKELVQTDRVEVYKCSQCGARVVFPRLNNVALLLDTRKGRCGEWATAFTAVCRALGWEARFIYDETDHIWTEVYFKSERRWVHCDPCECAIDKPLLYEKGWGKQLSYVLAFACDHVQDVTWRYSANHSAVLARRRQCSEQQLVQTIQELNKLRQVNVSAARRKALARSTLLELVELMSPAVEREGDGEGRQSGSLAWRLARSEVSELQASTAPYTWTPTPKEVSVGRLVLSYCSGKDEYCREVGGEKIKGWKTGVFSAENMFRKEEKDWKTVYLCRTENSVEGRLSWNIDFSSNGLKADVIEVTCVSKTFENGQVLWLLCSDDKCVPINNDLLRTEELRGSSVITLTATLSGGRGKEAWQHAQLFRQPLDACDPTFTLSISFIKT